MIKGLEMFSTTKLYLPTISVFCSLCNPLNHNFVDLPINVCLFEILITLIQKANRIYKGCARAKVRSRNVYSEIFRPVMTMRPRTFLPVSRTHARHTLPARMRLPRGHTVARDKRVGG